MLHTKHWGNSKEILNPKKKKTIKVTKEVARTSTKIYKPPTFTGYCGVKIYLKLEEAAGNRNKQMKTLVKLRR